MDHIVKVFGFLASAASIFEFCNRWFLLIRIKKEEPSGQTELKDTDERAKESGFS